MEVNLLELPKIKEVNHTIEPTWANDAGRYSNSGKFSGTFVGWFDTLSVNVGKTNQSEMTQIRNAIEKPIIKIKFIDSKTGESKVEEFYGTAISAVTNNIHGIYQPFTFNLKAVSKR